MTARNSLVWLDHLPPLFANSLNSNNFNQVIPPQYCCVGDDNDDASNSGDDVSSASQTFSSWAKNDIDIDEEESKHDDDKNIFQRAGDKIKSVFGGDGEGKSDKDDDDDDDDDDRSWFDKAKSKVKGMLRGDDTDGGVGLAGIRNLGSTTLRALIIGATLANALHTQPQYI
ncbi:hypothetical protein EV182_002763 [Spiromyces aspiralis]|uniref:Uncharacterized protein n=1 Tax=Spiromyces aspiralis TaxID=68401 RepID=A0ACC1HEC1_9FUNG|nr:hypothetical protein EV182_002763 [Spiromyces aspiralis]